MNDERRYDEAEVAEILEQATSEEVRASVPSPSSSGLTLAQLQDIGAEVGIPPDRIKDAALRVASRITPSVPQTFLGVPRSVSRSVSIPRALDDDEWTRLVVELRETFGAEGKVRAHGPLRTWSNGKLQVHVEPDGDHYRVRMQTIKSDAVPLAGFGALLTATGAILLLVNAGNSAPMGGVLALAGLGQLGYLRVLLRSWASKRASQMEALSLWIPTLIEE